MKITHVEKTEQPHFKKTRFSDTAKKKENKTKTFQLAIEVSVQGSRISIGQRLQAGNKAQSQRA